MRVAYLNYFCSFSAPPSYQESVFESTDIREADDTADINDGAGQVTFKPKYLAYETAEARPSKSRPPPDDDDDGESL